MKCPNCGRHTLHVRPTLGSRDPWVCLECPPGTPHLQKDRRLEPERRLSNGRRVGDREVLSAMAAAFADRHRIHDLG